MTMTKPITYAGRLERIFANLIDTLIMLLPNGILAGLMSGVEAQGEPVINPASLLVVFLCNTFYYTAFTAGSWQATPGQRLMGIYVIRTNGARLQQRHALERYLAYVIPSLPFYASFLPEEIAQLAVMVLSILWFAPILFNPNRAGMHDKLTHTRVVVGRRA